mmetsp:Transcript_132043/g.240222  ORF Transcript_132043/g.240222 Transcript_132043/m.240222 type:complete len:481 (+) Transcript_132043:80-1522(+)
MPCALLLKSFAVTITFFNTRPGLGSAATFRRSWSVIRRASSSPVAEAPADKDRLKHVELASHSKHAGDGKKSVHAKPGDELVRGNKMAHFKVQTNQSFEQWASTADWRNPRGSHLLDALVPFVELEHPLPLRPCPDDKRDVVTDADCHQSGDVFDGPRKAGPALLIDVSLLGFDLDLFELRLHELEGSVDVFCVIEMPITHRGQDKPLLWARNKDKPRFARFRDRILHVVVDDEHTLAFLHRLYHNRFEPVVWNYEWEQEKAGKAKLKKMLKDVFAKLKPGQEAVMSYGHVDELPSSWNLALVKHCNPRTYPIDNGAWMPMGRFDRAFRTDIPVSKDLPFTYGNPSFHNPNVSMFRALGRSGRYLLGGWHMTQSAYPPLQLVKELTCTECRGNLAEADIKLLRRGQPGVRAYFEKISSLGRWPEYLNRTVPLEELRADSRAPYKDRPDLLEPPRTVQCNADRYEIWFGHYDRRLSTPLPN